MKKQLRDQLPKKMNEPLGFITLHNRFVKHSQKKNHSSSTITSKSYHLYDFFGWCALIDITSPTEVTFELMDSYQKHIKNRKTDKGTPLKPSTIHSIFGALTSFFLFIFQEKLMLFSPARVLEFSKIQYPVISPLTHQEVEQIIRNIDISTPAGLRNRAIIETLYSSGIRRREVAKLKMDDVDLETGLIEIRYGKGRKERIVPIGERAVKWLKKYLIESRPLLMKNPEEKTLFISNHGKGFAVNSFTEILGDYLRENGKKGACHIFRHTAASLMLEGGAPVEQLQKFLGHAQIATTHIYTHVSTDKLKEVVNEKHPSTNASKQTPAIKKFVKPKGEKPIAPKIKNVVKTWLDISYEPGTLSFYAKEYINWMEQKEFSPLTISKRQQHLKRFLNWANERKITLAEHLSNTVLDCYQTYLVHLKRKDGEYINASFRLRILISFAKFLEYLFNKEIILTDLAATIALPKINRKLPKCVLSTEEVEKVFATTNTKNAMGVRNRTILELLYATAIESREVINVKVDDINIEENTLLVRESKLKKQRIVPITQRAIDWLKTYLCEVRPLMISDQTIESLFVGRYGSPLHRATLHELLRKHFKLANIGKSGGCQLFRYSAAIAMLDRDVDVRHLQEFLGHKTLSSTDSYKKFTTHKLKLIHNQTHPAKMNPTKGKEIFKQSQQGENQ